VTGNDTEGDVIQMPDTTEHVAETYFSAWQAKDFERLASILADDVTFVGPMGTANGSEEALRGLRGVREMVSEIVVEKRFVDGRDALTWFELRTAHTEPVPVANWSHVEAGKVTRIRVAFDPRPLLP
jgi:hypothetical protein